MLQAENALACGIGLPFGLGRRHMHKWHGFSPAEQVAQMAARPAGLPRRNAGPASPHGSFGSLACRPDNEARPVVDGCIDFRCLAKLFHIMPPTALFFGGIVPISLLPWGIRLIPE
jgi:hypothetical protein